MLASELSFLRSRLHRRSAVGVGVGLCAFCFPPKNHRLALFLPVDGFPVLPVWQPVCKQYVTVLHRAAKPSINGVARVPQGPAPQGVSLLAVLLGCVCFYHYLTSLTSGLPRVLADVPYLCLCPPVSQSLEGLSLSAAESQPGTHGQPVARLLPPVGHGWHCPFHVSGAAGCLPSTGCLLHIWS